MLRGSLAVAQVDFLLTRAVVPVKTFAVSEGRLHGDLLLLAPSRRLVNFRRTGHITISLSIVLGTSWARLKISLEIID